MNVDPKPDPADIVVTIPDDPDPADIIVTIPEVCIVTVAPGDGTGDAFVVKSATIISRSDMMSGNYDQTEGCFYQDDDGKVYYRLPTQCPFTAPADKEFDCWQASFGGTYTSGSFDIEEIGDFTITALWKDEEARSTADLSMPSTINVQYGDTQTAFDIRLNSITFEQGDCDFKLLMNDSSFKNSNGDEIPFTIAFSGDEARRNDSQGLAQIWLDWSDQDYELP